MFTTLKALTILKRKVIQKFVQKLSPEYINKKRSHFSKNNNNNFIFFLYLKKKTAKIGNCGFEKSLNFKMEIFKAKLVSSKLLHKNNKNDFYVP